MTHKSLFITPNTLAITDTGFGSSRMDLLIGFTTILRHSAIDSLEIAIGDVFKVAPYAYLVPGIGRSKTVSYEKFWHIGKRDLPDSFENEQRIKLIDTDIMLSNSVMEDSMEYCLASLDALGFLVRNAKITFESIKVHPYNITASITKYLLKILLSELIDRVTEREFNLTEKMLGFPAFNDERARHDYIHHYITNNNEFVHNWRLEIEERRAMVHRIALSKTL